MCTVSSALCPVPSLHTFWCTPYRTLLRTPCTLWQCTSHLAAFDGLCAPAGTTSRGTHDVPAGECRPPATSPCHRSRCFRSACSVPRSCTLSSPTLLFCARFVNPLYIQCSPSLHPLCSHYTLDPRACFLYSPTWPMQARLDPKSSPSPSPNQLPHPNPNYIPNPKPGPL